MPKHPLLFHESPEERRLRQERAYEDKLVRYLMGKYGLTKCKSYLLQEAQRSFGDTRLVLSLFLNSFGTFPAYLRTARIFGLAKSCTVEKLFNQMPTRRMTQLYFEYNDESSIPEEYVGKPFALVFPWKRISRGMVLHDANINPELLLPGIKKPIVRLVWTLPARKATKSGSTYLTLEPLEQFLSYVAPDWIPEKPFE